MNLRTLATMMSLVGFSFVAHGAPLDVGAAAPEVTSVDQNGKPVELKTVYAAGPTLVYFYPKADTPGCTKQACSLRDEWAALRAKGVQVLGVSADTSEDQKKFEEKYQLPFTLLADHDGKVSSGFGVEMRGKMTSRQSFLVKDGKIAWRMLKASTDNHAQDVMKAYDSLAQK